MGQKIKRFQDRSYLEYDRGKFDEWCVYLTHPDGSRRPPRDVDYFANLIALSEKYGTNRVYQDYVRVYEMTNKQVSEQVLKFISQLAERYGIDALEVDIIFSVLYLAMIAEEQKQYTRLGKRIKRLGIHVLLIEKRSVQDSANFMRGMGWRDIDALCRARGF